MVHVMHLEKPKRSYTAQRARAPFCSKARGIFAQRSAEGLGGARPVGKEPTTRSSIVQTGQSCFVLLIKKSLGARAL